MDVRNTGRWKSMDELAKYVSQGHVDKSKAINKAGGATNGAQDPIRTVWWFLPVTEAGVCGRDGM